MSIQLNVNVQTVAKTLVTTVGAAPDSSSDDLVRGSAQDDAIFTGAGDDRVWAGSGRDTIDGGDGHDVLFGEAGNDVLRGGAGNDRLDGGADNDVLYGDDGNDFIEGGAGDDVAYGGTGNDTVWGGSGNNILFGNEGNDDLMGGNQNDMLDGGEGNDLLRGLGGDDILTGGTGRDTFQYAIDNQQRNLNFGVMWGNDTITDFSSHPSSGDRIDMSWLFERLSDADVARILTAIDGLVNDNGKYNEADYTLTLKGKPIGQIQVGADYVESLEMNTLGGDQISVTLSASNVLGSKSTMIAIQNLSNASDTGATITLSNVADLHSYDFVRETMKAIHGTSSNDVIVGSEFDFIGSKGARIFGFAGDDTIDLSTATKNSSLSGGDGADRLFGGSANDTLSGDAGDDLLCGGKGNDTLNGGVGNDILSGGDGADSLSGDAGDDILNGGAGNDTLSGGTGRNELTGGAGNDTFVFNGTAQVNWGVGKAIFAISNSSTTITDFETGDKIRFVDFIKGPNQPSVIDQFVSTWFKDCATVVGNDLVLSGDNNADGVTDWSVTVVGRSDIYNDLTNDGSFNYKDYFLVA